MPISKSEDKMINLQYQMRENNLELQDYLKDLDNWEGEMKNKDETLKNPGDPGKSSDKLPAVRNSSKKKKKKKDNEKKKDAAPKTSRIKGSDYAAWEKFDVDKACGEVVDEKTSSDSEEFEESDEELEEEMQKQQALKQKDKGNEFFKLGNYDSAIDQYSFGLQLDPTNALILANRAMALLKQGKFAAAEQDCYSCLSLDPTYVKGYLRRATARTGLSRYEEAIADYEKVLKLEPTNKMATAEISKLQKLLGSGETSAEAGEEGVLSPIHKSPAERSKKPLRRIEIQETGIDNKDIERKEQIAKVTKERSETQKDMVTRDNQSFKQFVQPKDNTTTTTTTTADTTTTTTDPSVQSKDTTPPIAAAATTTTTTTTTDSSVQDTVSEKKSQDTTTTDCSVQPKDTTTTTMDSSVQSKDTTPPPPTTTPPTTTDSSVPGAVSEKKKKKRSKKSKQSAAARESTSPSTSTSSPSPPRSTSTSSPSTSSPPIPKSGQKPTQFQYNWPQVKNDPQEMYRYLKSITPEQYPQVISNFVDSEMVTKICSCLKTSFLPDGKLVLEHLTHLSEVNRFQMAIMFLSGAETKVIKDLFSELQKLPDLDQNQITKVSKLYGLK